MDNGNKTGSERSNQVSRRKVLGSMGAVSTLALAPNIVRADSTVEIPYVQKGDEVQVYKEVPADWYDHIQQVRKVKKNFDRGILSAPGVEATAVTASRDNYGGKLGHQLQVYATKEAASQIPSTHKGINVEVSEPLNLTTASCYYEDWDEIPGGVTNEAADEDGNLVGVGTSGLWVEDSRGRDRLLTADHLWTNESCSSSVGNILAQNFRGVGIVRQSEVSPDFSLVEVTNSDFDLQHGISQEGWLRDVSGWYTESAVSDLVSEGATGRKMGVTTGYTTGSIGGMYMSSSTCNDLEGHGVLVNADAGEGDSGGPMYGLESYFGSQWAVMLGHTTHASNLYTSETCLSGEEPRRIGRAALGHGWYHKYDKYGIDIGS